MRLIDADALPISFDGHTISVWKKDLDAAPTINPYEWISVKDRLPSEDDCVYLTYGYWTDDCSHSVYICLYSCDQWLSFSDFVVTHWMPIPTPPTEKEN